MQAFGKHRARRKRQVKVHLYYINKQKKLLKEILILFFVSLLVSLLTIVPDLSFYFDDTEFFNQTYGSINNLIKEGISSFLIMIILFSSNFLIFGFSDPTQKVSMLKIILSCAFLLVSSSFLREFFDFIFYIRPSLEASGRHIFMYKMTHSLPDVMTSIIVFFTSYAIHLVSKQHLMVMENQQLQTESVKHQFETLKSQLNPHMLFNSLNTLSTLVDESTQKAQEYIHELSYVLRYTMQQSKNIKVSLAEELEYSDAYIFLQKMRFEDNLQFNINIDESCNNKVLPPMSIQQLIENAIKHNQVNTRNPLTVNIYTEGNQWLVVSNHIQPKFNIQNSNTGIGLENLNKRYILLANREINITRKNNIFTVKIPLIDRIKIKS